MEQPRRHTSHGSGSLRPLKNKDARSLFSRGSPVPSSVCDGVGGWVGFLLNQAHPSPLRARPWSRHTSSFGLSGHSGNSSSQTSACGAPSPQTISKSSLSGTGRTLVPWLPDLRWSPGRAAEGLGGSSRRYDLRRYQLSQRSSHENHKLKK